MITLDQGSCGTFLGFHIDECLSFFCSTMVPLLIIMLNLEVQKLFRTLNVKTLTEKLLVEWQLHHMNEPQR